MLILSLLALAAWSAAVWALAGPVPAILSALLLVVLFGDVVLAAWLNRRVPVQNGPEAMVGCCGKVLDGRESHESGWQGRVSIAGEVWSAQAQEAALKPGDPVRVVAVNGVWLQVALAVAREA